MNKGIKKFVISTLIVAFCLISITARPIHIETDKPDASVSGSTELLMNFRFNRNVYNKIIFSDVNSVKDGNFDDLFDSNGLDNIELSKLDSGRLQNDSNVYLCWMVNDLSRIEKLTLEIPAPLWNGNKDYLDFYVAVDKDSVIGGKLGYGPSNSLVIFERDPNLPIIDVNDSVQLNLWTDDIVGKAAGVYLGSVVLRVKSGY